MTWSIPAHPTAEVIGREIVSHRQSAYNAKVTALALGAVSLLMIGGACLLWGLGTSPGMMLTGMNFFPYLAGTFIGAVAIVVVSGAALFTVKMGAHHYQINRLQQAIPQDQS